MKNMGNNYKVYNADVCLVCSATIITEAGGIRPMICGECGEKARKQYVEWNNIGIYLTKKDG